MFLAGVHCVLHKDNHPRACGVRTVEKQRLDVRRSRSYPDSGQEQRWMFQTQEKPCFRSHCGWPQGWKDIGWTYGEQWRAGLKKRASSRTLDRAGDAEGRAQLSVDSGAAEDLGDERNQRRSSVCNCCIDRYGYTTFPSLLAQQVTVVILFKIEWLP